MPRVHRQFAGSYAEPSSDPVSLVFGAEDAGLGDASPVVAPGKRVCGSCTSGESIRLSSRCYSTGSIARALEWSNGPGDTPTDSSPSSRRGWLSNEIRVGNNRATIKVRVGARCELGKIIVQSECRPNNCHAGRAFSNGAIADKASAI